MKLSIEKKFCDIPRKSSELIQEIWGHKHPFFIFNSSFSPEINSVWLLSLLIWVNKLFSIVLKMDQHRSGYFLIHYLAKLSNFCLPILFYQSVWVFVLQETFLLKHWDDSKNFYKDWGLFQSINAKEIRIDFIILRLL